MATVPDSIRRAKPLLGTFVEIIVHDPAPIDADDAIEAAFSAVARVHRLMSFHDPDSDVSRLNRLAASETVAVDPWTYRVLEAAIDLNRRSAGAFDVTIAPALQEIGPLPQQDQAPQSPAADVPRTGTIELLPDNCVRFQHAAIRVDLGGIAKGYAVDRAVESLRTRGVEAGVVNAGGDLAGFGPDPHMVEIRDPDCPARILSQAVLHDQALASTAPRFDPAKSVAMAGLAVIDPVTQMQVDTFRGATVRADTCMIADALTKVVMVDGDNSPTVLRHYQAAAMLVHRDGAVRVTDNW